MVAFADLLGPGDRARLTALTSAGQPPEPDLVDLARQAAGESHGDGRTAWLCVATALAAAASPGEARAALERVLDSGELRNLTLACLATITDTVN